MPIILILLLLLILSIDDSPEKVRLKCVEKALSHQSSVEDIERLCGKPIEKKSNQ